MVDFLGYKSPYRRQAVTPLPRAQSGQLNKPLRKQEPSLDRFNTVLRLRNRDSSPAIPAKYSPLPAIKNRQKPKLLREKTYDVLEPIFVKGPLPEDKIKLPEIKKPGGGSKTPIIGSSPRRATSRGGQLVTPKRNKTLAPEQTPLKRTRQAFKPNHLSSTNADSNIPSNVFWFPI